MSLCGSMEESQNHSKNAAKKHRSKSLEQSDEKLN